MRMESLSHLTEAKRLALDKVIALIGVDPIDQILTQGPEVLNARFVAFVRCETTLIGRIHDHKLSHMSMPYISVSKEERGNHPLILALRISRGKKGKISFS